MFHPIQLKEYKAYSQVYTPNLIYSQQQQQQQHYPSNRIRNSSNEVEKVELKQIQEVFDQSSSLIQPNFNPIVDSNKVIAVEIPAIAEKKRKIQEEPEQDSTSRLRNKACDNCRKRKVRCDKTAQCSSCTINEQTCIPTFVTGNTSVYSDLSKAGKKTSATSNRNSKIIQPTPPRISTSSHKTSLSHSSLAEFPEEEDSEEVQSRFTTPIHSNNVSRAPSPNNSISSSRTSTPKPILQIQFQPIISNHHKHSNQIIHHGREEIWHPSQIQSHSLPQKRRKVAAPTNPRKEFQPIQLVESLPPSRSSSPPSSFYGVPLPQFQQLNVNYNNYQDHSHYPASRTIYSSPSNLNSQIPTETHDHFYQFPQDELKAVYPTEPQFIHSNIQDPRFLVDHAYNYNHPNFESTQSIPLSFPFAPPPVHNPHSLLYHPQQPHPSLQQLHHPEIPDVRILPPTPSFSLPLLVLPPRSRDSSTPPPQSEELIHLPPLLQLPSPSIYSNKKDNTRGTIRAIPKPTSKSNGVVIGLGIINEVVQESNNNCSWKVKGLRLPSLRDWFD